MSELQSIAAKKRMFRIPKKKLRERMSRMASIKQANMTLEERSAQGKRMAEARIYKSL